MGFHSFVLLAEMRTGSNFLESNLNGLDGVTCHGEAFNPAFIGYPNRDDVLGVTLEQREENPDQLLSLIRNQVGLHGFRYFHDHDPRVIATVLDDAQCAKIILTRNPIDSYVSLKIAKATGQWKLTNPKAARSRVVRFDAREFETHLTQMQEFQIRILTHLQHSGQSAFYISYDDLHDLRVINGLAQWLGVSDRLGALETALKPQNPKPITDKVENAEAMAASLARLDRFNLARTPNFEPRRGPVAPSYLANTQVPVLFQPVRGGPETVIRDWLANLGGEVIEGFTQASLRKWQRQAKQHRAFSVLRHPLARLHAAYCEKILPTGPGTYAEIREALRRHHQVPLKAEPDAPGYDHRAGFEGFMTFVERNLNGQTSIRVDPYWATQSTVIQGFSELRAPDLLIREDSLAQGLAYLALDLGLETIPDLPDHTDPHLPRLLEIYDGKLEQRARQIYQRDFLSFGFGRLK